MKKPFLIVTVIFVLSWNTKWVMAQENAELAIEPFAFTASSPKDVTRNIKEVIAYSKSISQEFNQNVRGNLLFNLDGNTAIAEIETKFDGQIDLGGSDYSTLSDFFGIDFRKKFDYHFIPRHDFPTWYEAREIGNVWVDLNVVKNKAGVNNFIVRYYIPSKDATGKPYETEYNITSISMNDKPYPLPTGKKEYGSIRVATMFTDTLKSESNIIKVEIKVKGLGKFKLMYFDKNKGIDLSKVPIKGLQFYNLPAKTVYDDTLFFSMARAGIYYVKPDEKYQACIVLTLSNGKECPLKKKEKFTVRPVIQEFKSNKVDTLEKKSIVGKPGSVIYRYLFDVPTGTSALQFNYKAILECNNGGEINQGHINSCSVFIFREEGE